MIPIVTAILITNNLYKPIMKVKIKKLTPDVPTPRKSHASDFCYDCVAVSEKEIAPNVWKYGLGFALQMDMGGFKSSILYSIDARPRSSVWKTGMVLSNCIGTIDQDYTGEICAVFYHVMPDMPRYHVGDKICQIKIGSTVPIDFVEVDELDETERSAGGYGSTGR